MFVNRRSAWSKFWGLDDANQELFHKMVTVETNPRSFCCKKYFRELRLKILHVTLLCLRSKLYQQSKWMVTCQYYCFFLFFLRALPNNTFYLNKATWQNTTCTFYTVNRHICRLWIRWSAVVNVVLWHVNRSIISPVLTFAWIISEEKTFRPASAIQSIVNGKILKFTFWWYYLLPS